MARRWRIRHKLLFGLAAAVGILVLLLAGTVNGLWSYYVTMKSIGSKLEELDAAEDLKTDVGNLALLGTTEETNQARDESKKLQGRIRTAEDALDKFEAAFQHTLDRDLPPDDGGHIAGLILALRAQLADLRKLAPYSVPEGGGQVDTKRLVSPWREDVLKQAQRLDLTASDLRSAVRDGLTARIRGSKPHYQRTIAYLICVCAGGVLVTIYGMRHFYGWIYTPVRDLQQGVSRAARGDFDHRIEVHSGDEMEELAVAYNDMTSRLCELYKDMARQINERSRQLVRSERLASVGFLAAGVAHEINNPLASIAFCSEALEARLAEMREQLLLVSGRGGKEFDIFRKYLKMIQEEAFRCKNITERLLEFSRGGERKRERTDLAELVQSVLDVAQHLQNSKGKQVTFRPAAPVCASVNVEEIKSVVLNLVVNALDSMDEGGRLTVTLAARDGTAELAFTDTGCGMTAEVQDNIFEPFFTRNRSGKGTGLGLTITHRIISQHGGEIEAASPGAGQGSTFTVRIPLQPGAAATEKEETIGNAAA